MKRGKLPRWKQWIMRHIIGDFEVFSLERGIGPSYLRAGNPGGWNTVEEIYS